jgi:replicative DNA helicase
MRIEHAILKSLIFNEDYTRKVLPFLKDEYFGDRIEKLVFKEIESYITKYNSTPTYESLVIEVNNKNITEDEFKGSIELLDELNQNKNERSKEDWLVNETEKFCQDKAILNGVREAISILDGKSKTHEKGAIPDILTKALSVSFDNNIGHDYIDDFESRYDFYHRKEEKIPFDLDYFNKITKGGLPKKSLNIILAGPGVGKSLLMCHHAAACLMQGKNVLYITMEMAEQRIAERIDANLLNVTVDDIQNLSREDYSRRVGKLKTGSIGKLIIKEYPTATAGANHFRALLNELNLKKNFVPDILIIDYMNICSSSRLKMGASVNSYTFVKSIAEELRGLAVEFDVPLLTASQLTRSGAASSDPNMDDVSESFGVAATADLMFALISTEELEQLNQLMVKQIKNRYYDPTKNKRFVIGVDRSKMKLYDAEASAQQGIVDSGQPETETKQKSNKKSFDEFKF